MLPGSANASWGTRRFTAFSGENFAPFAPFGVAGIGVAASSIFFTFIGLDAVSTAGEEVHDPRRTLPLAIVLATIIVTTVYILVAIAGFALYIISQLPYSTFALFAVWLGVAAIIYFTYSARHSRLGRGEAVATEEQQ